MAKTIIYLEDVIEALMECGDWYSDDDEARRGVSQCIGVIHDLPSAQPGRKMGKWIGYNTEQDGWKRTDGSPVFMSCSECNGLVLNNGSANWNYCPSCGARMDDESNET